MDCNWHTVARYINEEKAHFANVCKLLNKLNGVNNSIYEVELSKAEIQHKGTIIVGSFILQ